MTGGKQRTLVIRPTTLVVPGGFGRVLLRHPLISFFAIAYAFSWLTLIPYILSCWGWLHGDWTLLFAVHTFGPAVAAVVVAAATEGRPGVNRLRQRIRMWRFGWRWYVFILLGIPALIVLGIIVQPAGPVTFHGLTPVLLASYPLTFVAVFFGGGPLGEEIGWRGFALPRMQPRYGPFWATALLGVLWAGWHLADFLTPAQGGGPGTDVATFMKNFLLFLALVLSLAVIFTWLFNHTKGSIFAAILAHASIDTPQAVGVPAIFALSVTALNTAWLIAFALPAVAIVIATRGHLGYDPAAISRDESRGSVSTQSAALRSIP